jgi:enoyl-CoA hydratase/carnithine racemase
MANSDGNGHSPWKFIKVSDLDGIIIVQIARPDARNALNSGLMAELTTFARHYRRTPTTRVVILTGQDRYFSAGVQLGAAQAAPSAPVSLLEQRSMAAAGPDLCKAWEEIEAITIAAIEGFCVGGACALVLACDFRIMGQGSFMRLPEVPLGMNMSWRTLPRLQSLIGLSRAKQMVLFGEPISAETSIHWGLADETCPQGEALNHAKAWAKKVAALPPIPVRMTKEALNAAANANADAVSFMDRDQFLLTAKSKDFGEGVNAFLEKRPPNFSGE